MIVPILRLAFSNQKKCNGKTQAMDATGNLRQKKEEIQIETETSFLDFL